MKNLITKSPCIKICQLDERSVCIGCNRDIKQIASWNKMSDEEKNDWWYNRLKEESREKNNDTKNIHGDR